MQHTESLARDKEGVVARYRESLALVPGVLADLAARGDQAVQDMAGITGGVEASSEARYQSVLSDQCAMLGSPSPFRSVRTFERNGVSIPHSRPTHFKTRAMPYTLPPPQRDTLCAAIHCRS